MPAIRVQMLPLETIARSVQAHDLQTHLVDAVWVDPNEYAARAARRLRKHDFDQAPSGVGGRVGGYVLTAELEAADKGARAGHVVRQFDAQHVISESAPVLSIMELFNDGGPFAFVVDGRTITGFITVSDLNMHPARTHFYLLLANFEIALAAWVRKRFTDLHTTLQFLGRDADRVARRLDRDEQHNVEVDLVAGMDLRHLLAIAGSRPDGQRLFGSSDFANWDDWVRNLVSLRNAVMHPVLTFLGPRRSVADLVAMEHGLRDVIVRLGPAGSLSAKHEG